MTSSQTNPKPTDNNQTILNLYNRVLPLVDGVANKLRLLIIFGALLVIWLGVWFGLLKKFALALTAAVVGVASMPLLILLRFWWSLEELTNLPEIAGEMMGDAKSEAQAHLQNLRQGKMPRVNLLTTGKNLWSVGAILRESKELLGSYVSITTLVNPFMLFLAIASIFSILAMAALGLVLVFFI